MSKTHFVDTRLYVNAGMRFPACYARAPLLDTDKGRLPSTTAHDSVTCKHCRRIMRKTENRS